jgi:hypothetical protein
MVMPYVKEILELSGGTEENHDTINRGSNASLLLVSYK